MTFLLDGQAMGRDDVESLAGYAQMPPTEAPPPVPVPPDGSGHAPAPQAPQIGMYTWVHQSCDKGIAPRTAPSTCTRYVRSSDAIVVVN